MKVIFLDIDGVLNTSKIRNPRNLPYVVERRFVSRLKRVLKKTRAKIVLSSTWRYDPAGLFSAKYHGIPFIDCTPDFPNKPRRDEILAWLRRHPGVTRFAVIDDDDDELDALPLFQPNPSTGLTPEIDRAVTAFLLGKSDKDMRRGAAVRLVANIANAVTGHRG